MRKNNLLNKNIVKAFAIGISASMAFQPVVSFANEGEDLEPADDHINEAENTDASDSETSKETYDDAKDAIEDADDAIDTAAEEVEKAETATDEDLSDAGEALDSAKEDVEKAEEHIEAADESNSDALEKSEDFGMDITLIDDKTNEADENYKDAVDAADKAVEANESIDVNSTTSEEAEKKVEEVKENVESAKDKLAKANEALTEAQKAYDDALALYDEIKKDAVATELAISDAEDELAFAKETLENAKKSVADAKDACDKELEDVKNANYQKIIDAQKEISEMTGDEEDYQDKMDELAKMIIKYYVIDSTDIDEGTEISFDEESYEVITDYEKDEEGNYLTDEDGQYIAVQTVIPVKYVIYTKDGEQVVRKYEYSVNDGVISVSEKEIDVQEDEIEVKAEVPENYTTEDGSKTYVETETSHIVYIDSEDEHQGFYAIDTSDSDTVISAETSEPENKEDGNTRVIYKPATGVGDVVTYDELGEHEVIDETETVVTPVSEPKKTSAYRIDNVINDYIDEGYSVKVTYKHLITGRVEELDVNNISIWTQIKAGIKEFFGIKSFTVQAFTSEEVPTKTHMETGIYETVTRQYEVTTETDTITTKHVDGKYYYYDLLDAVNAAKDEANKYIEENTKDNVKITYTWNTTRSVWNGYRYFLDYVITTTDSATTTEDIVVSKTLYDATDYTKYNAKQDAINRGIYIINTSESQIGSTADKDFTDAVEAQNKALDDATKAQKAAADANTAYNDALDKVKIAQDKVDALRAASVGKKELVDAQYQLTIALAELDVAKENKKDAEDAVEKAKKALDDANDKLDKIKKQEADRDSEGRDGDRDSDGDRRDGEDRDGSNDNSGNNGSSETSTVIPVIPVSTNTSAAVTTVSEAAPVMQNVVLGDRRSPAAAADTTEDGSETIGNAGDNEGVAAEGELTDNKPETTDSEKETVAIEDEDVAKAASAEDTAKKSFPWWILVLAAIAGVSAEEYYRRKNNKNKVEE